MRHDEIDLDPTRDQQDGPGSAADTIELRDDDLGQVSGGCRKAGGEQLELTRRFQPIIAI